METEYKMIFSGTRSDVILIESQLNRHKIVPIIKDEEESVRLSGFAHPVSEQIKVFVYEDEVKSALNVLGTLNI